MYKEKFVKSDVSNTMLYNALNSDNIHTIQQYPLKISTKSHYLSTILEKSQKYLKETFNSKQYKIFLESLQHIYALDSIKEIVKAFEKSYIVRNSYDI